MDKVIMKDAHILCTLQDIAVQYAIEYNHDVFVFGVTSNITRKCFDRINCIMDVINKAWYKDGISLKATTRHIDNLCLFDTLRFIKYNGETISDTVRYV